LSRRPVDVGEVNTEGKLKVDVDDVDDEAPQTEHLSMKR
jgi:hypothetical protein